MSGILKRENDALATNPNQFYYPLASNINITTHGSDFYWAVTAVMTLSTFIFVALSFRVPRRNRIFHYITAAITLVAAIAYFTMASNLGYAAIMVEFDRPSRGLVAGSVVAGQMPYREIFYVRYIDWFVTTPLLLLDLLLTAGLPWPTILYTILLDEIMVVTGLVGALVASSYKWGYFVFATVALFAIAWNVTWVGRLHARRLGPNVSKTYLYCGSWTIFLWFIYPIAWGLCEGANVLSPDSEAVFYGVLDLLAKPVFGALLIFGHRNIDPAVLGLHIRDYDDDIVHNEKSRHGLGSAAHPDASHNGATGVNTAPVYNNDSLPAHGTGANAVVGDNTTSTGVIHNTAV